MGLLNTSVCAAIIGLALAGSANAQDAGLHPQLGQKMPRQTLNSDLLALPAKERAAWVHGAMVQMTQILASTNPEQSKCIMDWYFEIGNGAEYIPKVIEHYKDHPAAATIFAATEKVCPRT